MPREPSSEQLVLKTCPPFIDAVVTWVDTTDPRWVRSYEKHTGTKFRKSIRFTVANNPEAELANCLSLVKKNMPWLREVFVVTKKQRPKCITTRFDVLGRKP